MRKASAAIEFVLLLCLGAFSASAGAFQGVPDDVIKEISSLETINATDQRRIAEWIQAQLDKLKALPPAEKQEAMNPLVERLRIQATDRQHSQAFRTQLILQCTQIAVTEFGKAGADPTVVWTLARALLDFDAPDTYPALLAGLGSGIPVVRYLCARGLTLQRDALTKDKQKQGEVFQAVQAAGSTETSSVVLSHFYRLLAFPTPTPESLAVFSSLFDRRLAWYREKPRLADAAEIEAFEYFRSAAAAALNEAQKVQWVQRIAVFLRVHAERYHTENLAQAELTTLEYLLESEEAALQSLTGNKAPGITDELAKGGHSRRAEVLAQAYRWVGNLSSKEPGTLQAAPWNVPLGAP